MKPTLLFATVRSASKIVANVIKFTLFDHEAWLVEMFIANLHKRPGNVHSVVVFDMLLRHQLCYFLQPALDERIYRNIKFIVSK